MAKCRAYKSKGSSCERPRIFKRGGSRNRKGRATLFLSDKETMRLATAMRTASAIELPLNRFITIHWERAGCVAGKEATATGSFLKSARDVLRKRGLPFAYIWVRENDLGDGTKGNHVHILAHIPEGLSIGHLQRRWLREITGVPYRRGVIKTRCVGGAISAARALPEHFEANLAAVGRYVLKGATRGASEALDLGDWGNGGRIIGQRTGMSRNLR